MSTGDAPSKSEYDRLLRFLVRPGGGFGLAVAHAATQRDCDRVAASVRLDLRGGPRQIGVLDLETIEDGDLVDMLARQAEAGAHVILVQHGDRMLLDAWMRPRIGVAIERLNRARDELPGRVSARVVWLMSTRAHVAFRGAARDLDEIVLSRFEFGGSHRIRHAPIDLLRWQHAPRAGPWSSWSSLWASDVVQLPTLTTDESSRLEAAGITLESTFASIWEGAQWLVRHRPAEQSEPHRAMALLRVLRSIAPFAGEVAALGALVRDGLRGDLATFAEQLWDIQAEASALTRAAGEAVTGGGASRQRLWTRLLRPEPTSVVRWAVISRSRAPEGLLSNAEPTIAALTYDAHGDDRGSASWAAASEREISEFGWSAAEVVMAPMRWHMLGASAATVRAIAGEASAKLTRWWQAFGSVLVARSGSPSVFSLEDERQASAAFADLGDRVGMAQIGHIRAEQCLSSGEPHAAIELVERELPVFERCGDRHSLARARHVRAQALLAVGRDGEAVAVLQEVVRELLSFGDHHALGRAFETLAESGTAEERAACLRAAAEQYAAADEWAAAGTLELRRAELVGDQRLATSLAERFHAAGAAELRDRARAIATLARSRPPK